MHVWQDVYEPGEFLLTTTDRGGFRAYQVTEDGEFEPVDISIVVSRQISEKKRNGED